MVGLLISPSPVCLCWHPQFGGAPDQFTHRSYGINPTGQLLVRETQLQRRTLCALWREPSECLRGVAILVDWSAEIGRH